MESVKERMKSLVNFSKFQAKNWVFVQNYSLWQHKVDNFIDKTTKNMETKIKSQMIEQYMPQVVKNFVEETFQYIWKNATDMIKQEARSVFFKDAYTLYRQQRHVAWLMKPWYVFRNWLVYKIIPYDKGFWQQVRDWRWVVLMVLFYTPYYGIQTFMYLIFLLAIDKSETFQLVNFILSYKNTQFFTTGCLNVFYGYMTYYYCADLLPNIKFSEITSSSSVFASRSELEHLHSQIGLMLQSSHDHFDVKHISAQSLIPKEIQNHKCIHHGPDSTVDFRVDFLCYIIQIFIIWGAFYLLKYSRPLQIQVELESHNHHHSRKTLRKEASHLQRILHIDNKGGRLKWFLLYDLYAFIFTLIVFTVLFLCFYQYNQSWNQLNYDTLTGLMFFIRVLYGLLSLPFVLFIFRIFVTVFTSARPTAYDERGNLMYLQGTSGTQLVYTDSALEAVFGNIQEVAMLPERQ